MKYILGWMAQIFSPIFSWKVIGTKRLSKEDSEPLTKVMRQ
jgi:hypothetical protein